MPFITTMTLTSGDRPALDALIGDIRERASTKGIEFKGPHTHPPKRLRVPQYRRLDGSGGTFGAWDYSVYERTLELAGHDETVRRVADWDFPPGIHVEIEVSRVRSVGSKR